MVLKKTKCWVTLEDLLPGSLFLYKGTLGLKTEYRTSEGAIEAFIVGSGEMFWGGIDTPEQQLRLRVRKVKLIIE